MARKRWAFRTIPILLGTLLLPAFLHSQQYEQNVTATLLRGHVAYAGDEQPAERVDIELTDEAGAIIDKTVTGWGGEFHFSNLKPGKYTVSADEPGCEPQSAAVAIPANSDFLEMRLRRSESANVATVSVRDLSIPVKARLALRDGIQLLNTDYVRSIENLRRAVALYPNYYEAYYVMGLANLTVERLAEAETAFRKSIDLSGRNYARALLALGAVLCDQARVAEAEPVIREGLEIDDTPSIGHLLLGRALFGLGRWSEAENSVHQALLRQPDSAEAYLLLVHIHSRQSRPLEAQKDLAAFLELEPQGAISDIARRIQQARAVTTTSIAGGTHRVEFEPSEATR